MVDVLASFNICYCFSRRNVCYGVEKTARVVILRHCWTFEGDMFAVVSQKSCLLFEEINVEVTVILWLWLFRGRNVRVSRKCCPEVK